MNVKVEISLKKGHPRREMKIANHVITETPKTIEVEESFLKTGEAKHWFIVKPLDKKSKKGDFLE